MRSYLTVVVYELKLDKQVLINILWYLYFKLKYQLFRLNCLLSKTCQIAKIYEKYIIGNFERVFKGSRNIGILRYTKLHC